MLQSKPFGDLVILQEIQQKIGIIILYIVKSIFNFIRDMVLEQGGLVSLCNLVFKSDKLNITKHGTWSISNLCRGN